MFPWGDMNLPWKGPEHPLEGTRTAPLGDLCIFQEGTQAPPENYTVLRIIAATEAQREELGILMG